MERYGHVRLPRGFIPWKPGKCVFFSVIDGQIVVSFKPLKLYLGRYISSVLMRTVWRKSDGDFMRQEAKAMKRRLALRRMQKMKDRSHEEAMTELFQEDPASAVDLVNSILDDGDQDDLRIAFRQMDKAGLFDRAGVLYEVACDVIGAIIAHYSEALALERGKPAPDVAVVEQIKATKHALRLERDELVPSNLEAIKAVIQKYAFVARRLYMDPVPVDAGLVQRGRSLVGRVEVDLDARLSPDDE